VRSARGAASAPRGGAAGPRGQPQRIQGVKRRYVDPDAHLRGPRELCNEGTRQDVRPEHSASAISVTAPVGNPRPEASPKVAFIF
jgi:hypothetical protein